MAESIHIDRADLETLLRRDRAEVERERNRFWARQRELMGPAASLRASESLSHHMRSVQPDWPSAREREADLAHHVTWTTLVDRVGRALSGH
jgi:hypothetical protein